ncbi:HAMP domain-containing protein [Pseudothauera nasutitermitis]|uniref:histidine kinase n=1 Tax=Pseudothauera nasutitermitis TaxID=2565930 RepID=A0A4S4ATE8_9RHOO|nr:ATP-binding protein [Pseudothauera nasutitermitis]THF62449.1 HAMP domain-containing protein [Pseudothauera nasutitermitis]
MRLPWPRSLFARLMLIWLIGIALVLAVSLALFIGERDRVGRDALFEGIAQEIAATAEVLDRLAPRERERWIDELGRRRLRLTLRPLPDHVRPAPLNHPLLPALRAAMPERAAALYLHPRGDGPHGVLLARVNLADGSPLAVRLPNLPPAPELPAPPPGRLLAALAALVGGVLLLTWLAVRIATRPLSRMAEAARRLGEEPERAPPLDPRGPTEVAQAAAAFNQMQSRVREHVAERTRILAAISHDLQTPITRLRLRAELLDDDNLRARFQSDLDAMQALVREGLDYARSMDDATPAQPVDLNGLLEALCDDAADMGWTVRVHGQATAPCPARPGALRRALWNLLENGVKFGERVEINLSEDASNIHLRVRDHGPGLPPEELEKVFEPFYRTEASRNRETGGTGLGLAIARNLLRAQGGDVALANHPQGGLQATVTLPRQARG